MITVGNFIAVNSTVTGNAVYVAQVLAYGPKLVHLGYAPIIGQSRNRAIGHGFFFSQYRVFEHSNLRLVKTVPTELVEASLANGHVTDLGPTIDPYGMPTTLKPTIENSADCEYAEREAIRLANRQEHIDRINFQLEVIKIAEGKLDKRTKQVRGLLQLLAEVSA